MDSSLIIALGVFIVALGLMRFASGKQKTDSFAEHPIYDEKESHELGKSAKEKFDKGVYKDALRDADEALTLESDNLYLLWLRASIHNALKNSHLAIEDCEHIISINKSYHWAYEQRGLAYLNLRQFPEAKADFMHLLKLNKNSDRAYFHLLIIAVEEKDESISKEFLQKILSLPYLNWDGLTALAKIIYEKKAYSIVIPLVDEAIAKGTNAEESLLFYRAWSHYYLKNYPQAIADAERILALNSASDVALRIKGYSYKATKDFEQAASAFQALYEKKSEDLQIASVYADCLRYLRRFEDALVIIQAVQALKPDESAYTNLEGLIYLGANRFEEAVLAFTKAIELKADESMFYDNRSLSYRLSKNLPKAWEDADKALSLKPDSAYLYCTRAELFLADGKPEAALQSVEKALELDENSVYAYSTLARIHIHWDNFHAAFADIQKAQSFSQNIPWQFNVIEALIEAARGNHERAQNLWKQAASFDEKHWDESWVILEYDLPEKLLPYIQSFINSK